MTNSAVSCCCSLRAGMITYGSIFMVLIGLSVAGAVKFLVEFDRVEDRVEDQLGENSHYFMDFMKVVYYIVLGLDALWVFFGVLMFIPTCSEENQTNKRWFIMPWIVLHIIWLVLGGISLIYFMTKGVVFYYIIIYALVLMFFLWGTILSITYFKSLGSQSSGSSPPPYYKMQENA